MPIIPLGDDNHHRSNHWLNWTFIIIGIAVMAYTVTVDRNFTLATLEPWMLHSSFDLGFNAESTKLIGASIFMHQNPALRAVDKHGKTARFRLNAQSTGRDGRR